MDKGISPPILVLSVIIIGSIIVVAGYLTFFTGGPETNSYYLSINPDQRGSNLIVSGESNLPENSKLEINISGLGVSRTVTLMDNQYELVLERSVNAPSENCKIIVFFSPVIQSEYVKDQVGEKGKLMRGTLVDNSEPTWILENSGEISWIQVNSPPEPDFNYKISGHIVQFTDDSEDSDGTITREWDFGIIEKGSENKNPTFTYENRGVYTVTLTVTDNGGAERKCTRTISITDTFSFSWDYTHPKTSKEGIFHQKLTVLDEWSKYDELSHYVYSIEEVKMFITPNDKMIENLANGLKKGYLSEYSQDNEILADFVLEFVQEAIPYEKYPYDDLCW